MAKPERVDQPVKAPRVARIRARPDKRQARPRVRLDSCQGLDDGLDPLVWVPIGDDGDVGRPVGPSRCRRRQIDRGRDVRDHDVPPNRAVGGDRRAAEARLEDDQVRAPEGGAREPVEQDVARARAKPERAPDLAREWRQVRDHHREPGPRRRPARRQDVEQREHDVGGERARALG